MKCSWSQNEMNTCDWFYQFSWRCCNFSAGYIKHAFIFSWKEFIFYHLYIFDIKNQDSSDIINKKITLVIFRRCLFSVLWRITKNNLNIYMNWFASQIFAVYCYYINIFSTQLWFVFVEMLPKYDPNNTILLRHFWEIWRKG